MGFIQSSGRAYKDENQENKEILQEKLIFLSEVCIFSTKSRICGMRDNGLAGGSKGSPGFATTGFCSSHCGEAGCGKANASLLLCRAEKTSDLAKVPAQKRKPHPLTDG